MAADVRGAEPLSPLASADPPATLNMSRIPIATRRLSTAVVCHGLLAVLFAGTGAGEVVRVEIGESRPFADGAAFGEAGAYDRVTGRLYFEVDPAHTANRRIVDLTLAPRTASGRVAFSADFFLLKPRDPGRGNGRLLYDVNNRGNKLALHALNGAGGNNPSTSSDAGNGFLMRQGYAVLWSGWNGDVLPGGDRLQIELPVARGPEGDITGRVYSEICVDEPTDSVPLCWGNTRVYPAASVEEAGATLSVRPQRSGTPTPLPRDEWAFARVENGRIVPDATRLHLEQGFKPGWLYDLVYTAKDPRVSGLGFAAVRDAVAFFRYGRETTGSRANPLAGAVQHAYGFGISQSGRFLQDLVCQDFNGDEQNRTVFDGCFVHVAGAGRTLLNERFAQITRHGSQHEDNLYPTDAFPFTTVPQEDPLTHQHGDWPARSRSSGHLPKLILMMTSTEYFGRGGSLLHTNVEGSQDVPIDPSARLYHIAGGNHLFTTPTSQGIAAYPMNTLEYTPLLRALLVCLDEWVSSGREPPPSAYPRIADGTLVSLDRYRRMFPDVPGVSPPDWIYTPLRLDLGPRYASEGIVDFAPPKAGPPYRTLVPAVDEDGNEVAGVRLPQVAVPLATFIGWNKRAERFGAPRALTRWAGASFPLPAGPEAALQTGDPRRSVLERYPSREDYESRVKQVCNGLVEQRLLLDEDVARIVAREPAVNPWSVPGVNNQ